MQKEIRLNEKKACFSVLNECSHSADVNGNVHKMRINVWVLGKNSRSHVSENASETQTDTTMTFTVLILSIGQNEEFQESRVHYTLARIKSLLKIGRGWFLGARGGFRNPWNPPSGYAPVNHEFLIVLPLDWMLVHRWFNTPGLLPSISHNSLHPFVRV